MDEIKEENNEIIKDSISDNTITFEPISDVTNVNESKEDNVEESKSEVVLVTELDQSNSNTEKTEIVKEVIEEETRTEDNLNVKALKKMNQFYEKMYKELIEKNDPEEKEKIEAIKKEIEKNNEILNKFNLEPEQPKVKINEIKEVKQEPQIKQEKKEEKFVVILDCLRGEYLIRKNDLTEFKAYEIRTKLLDNKDARKNYFEHLHEKFGDFENKEVDITLCKALEEHFKQDKSDEIIKKYIDAINEIDKEKLPFKLAYNFDGLKDLRKEGFLTRGAVNKLVTIADFCDYNKLADVKKEEKGLKRVINSVKKFFSKREFRGNIEFLNEGEKSRKIIITFKDGVYSLECGKSKGKKYGDVYVYDAKCIIDDDKEIDKIRKLYDIKLSNKDISRIDITVFKLLKNFEKLNTRVEDRDLNELAEQYIRTIVSKELGYEVDKQLDIIYDLGCFDYISEEVLSDYDIKQLKKKAKFAEKIGLAEIKYSEDSEEPSDELKKLIFKDEYFCKVADENDLDDKDKKAIEEFDRNVKERLEFNKNKSEIDIISELAKENNIALKFNNIKKTLKELRCEIIEKIVQE